MEQHIFIVKLYYKTKSYSQVQTKFRTLFPECLPPNKTTIWKNVENYGMDGTSSNINKGRSGNRMTTRTQENFEVVWQVLERNQGIIIERRNGLGILP